MQLFSMDSNALWNLDADAYLITFETQDRDRDFITDHHCFLNVPG